MFVYGGCGKTLFYKNLLGFIINQLPEEQWYKLKWNSKILWLLGELRKSGSVRDLSLNGHIESLNGQPAHLKSLCQTGNFGLVQRYIWGKTLNWNQGPPSPTPCPGLFFRLWRKKVRGGGWFVSKWE